MRLMLFAALLVITGCKDEPTRPSTAPAPARATATPTDERTVRIEESSPRIGTQPGRVDRDPVSEADLVAVRVPAFGIGT